MIKVHTSEESDNPWTVLLDNALGMILKEHELLFIYFPVFDFCVLFI